MFSLHWQVQLASPKKLHFFGKCFALHLREEVANPIQKGERGQSQYALKENSRMKEE
jgi:hypothetical protein